MSPQGGFFYVLEVWSIQSKSGKYGHHVLLV